MEMQRYFKSIVVNLTNLSPYGVDSRISPHGLDHFEFRDLYENNYRNPPFAKQGNQLFCRTVNEFVERTFTVSIYLVINCENTFNHLTSSASRDRSLA